MSKVEQELLQAIKELHDCGEDGVTGWQIAKKHAEITERRIPIGHGTLYRALHSLRRGRSLCYWREDVEAAEQAGRPRRHFYRMPNK